MSDQLKVKNIEINLKKGLGKAKLFYWPRLSNCNIFVWHKDGERPFERIAFDQNQAGNVFLGDSEGLTGDTIDLAFEVKNDAQSGPVKFYLSGGLEVNGERIPESEWDFEDSYDGELAVRVIRWTFQ